MHEFSIAENIVDVVGKAVGSRKRLLSVSVTLGPLSGISAEALRFCFTEVAKQKGFGSPELIVNEIAAKLHCCDCGLDYESMDFFEGCPGCRSLNRRVISGHEFTVDEAELMED